MTSFDAYLNEFEGHVFAAIGGLEMANEFFAKHSGLRNRLPGIARHHYGKGWTAMSGAEAWFNMVVRPILHREFQKAI
jgi:hypothetical protein